MSSELYKTNYQASLTANRIVKDLVKQKLPKGQTFDPVRALKSNPMQWIKKNELEHLLHGAGPLVAGQSCTSNTPAGSLRL